MDHRKRVKTIRYQLLLAINIVVGVGFLIGLALDYQHALSSRLREKHIALREEAATMRPAIRLLQNHSLDAVQAYIDTVCAEMRDPLSPGHHIVVNLDGIVLQARAHDRASPAMLRAMEAAAQSRNWRATAGEEELIVGSSTGGGVTVHVSEYLAELRAFLHRQLLWRLLAIILIGAVGALLLNVMLYRTITRPIRMLVGALRGIGAGRFNEARLPSFNSEELAFLSDEIGSMRSALATAERTRQSQMDKAREIQNHLHPDGTQVPGLRIISVYEPAEDVGGDYFDILPLADGSWLLCVADVVGHGVPAAMGAAILKTLLTAATDTALHPDKILESVNRRFCGVSPTGNFATMLLVRWLPRQQIIEYASAGHESGVLAGPNGEVELLPSTGTILSISKTESWQLRRLDVSAGTRLLLFTDGLSESSSREGEHFGRTRVAQSYASNAAVTLEQATQRLRAELDRHRGGSMAADDATFLAVEVVAGPDADDQLETREATRCIGLSPSS